MVNLKSNFQSSWVSFSQKIILNSRTCTKRERTCWCHRWPQNTDDCSAQYLSFLQDHFLSIRFKNQNDSFSLQKQLLWLIVMWFAVLITLVNFWKCLQSEKSSENQVPIAKVYVLLIDRDQPRRSLYIFLQNDVHNFHNTFISV